MIRWLDRGIGRRGVAALGALAVLGCVSGSSTPPEDGEASRAGGEGDGVTVVVDGEERDFGSPTVRLCSEGFPAELRVELTARDAHCPEQLVQGPAGSPLARGRVCDELLVQVREFELGVPVAARGSSSALVAYARFEEPALVVSTGDAGPRGTTGSIIVEELAEADAGEIRLRFSISLAGEAEVDASATVSVTPAPCAAAALGPLPG